MVVRRDFRNFLIPEAAAQRHVQEAFDYVVRFDTVVAGNECLANLRCRGFGCLAARLEQGEYHERIVALELPAGALYLDGGAGGLRVEAFHCAGGGLFDVVFYVHVGNLFVRCRGGLKDKDTHFSFLPPGGLSLYR